MTNSEAEAKLEELIDEGIKLWLKEEDKRVEKELAECPEHKFSKRHEENMRKLFESLREKAKAETAEEG